MNCESLKEALDKVGVPSTAYSILDDNLSEVAKNGGYLLEFEKEQKEWNVYRYENGTKDWIASFYSEVAACDRMYYELTETNPNFSRLLESLLLKKTRGLKDPDVVESLRYELSFNAGATEPRLVSSLLQLQALLLIKRVPFRAYSILGSNLFLDPNGGRSLKYDFERNCWNIWIYERGIKGLILESDSKTEACTVFYYLLVDGLHKASRSVIAETPTMTCETLRDFLVEKGIPRKWYSILGDTRLTEYIWLLLEYNSREKTWDLFNCERGLKNRINTHYSESAACDELRCSLLLIQEIYARCREG